MSFLDNARRAFGGKPEDYYEDDRYEDEDYEDYDEEEPKKSFFSFLSKRTDDEDYEEEESYEKEPVQSRRYSSYSSSRTTEPRERYSSFTQKPASTPAPTRTNLSGVEVTVHYPASLDDATRIIREVKSSKITIFDISAITSDDEARRVVDYIGGAAFGMECPFERLCPSIFCIAPVGVKIDAKKNRY